MARLGASLKEHLGLHDVTTALVSLLTPPTHPQRPRPSLWGVAVDPRGGSWAEPEVESCAMGVASGCAGLRQDQNHRAGPRVPGLGLVVAKTSVTGSVSAPALCCHLVVPRGRALPGLTCREQVRAGCRRAAARRGSVRRSWDLRSKGFGCPAQAGS